MTKQTQAMATGTVQGVLSACTQMWMSVLLVKTLVIGTASASTLREVSSASVTPDILGMDLSVMVWNSVAIICSDSVDMRHAVMIVVVAIRHAQPGQQQDNLSITGPTTTKVSVKQTPKTVK